MYIAVECAFKSDIKQSLIWRAKNKSIFKIEGVNNSFQ